jgi:carboxypeptidase family protein
MTTPRLPLLAGLLLLAITSLHGQTQPPPAQGQGQTQGQGQGGQGPGGQGQGGRGQQRQQARDRAQTAPQGTSVISGRVLTADTGRPVKRARVIVSGGGRGGRTTTTDDQGRYQVGELTAGSYNVTASKNGFVDSVYGQRRPQQPGTPVTLADAQAVGNIDLRLTRGGVITGIVRDEDGEALPRALVTVQRYQYVQGQRQLTPAGADQTDDRGQYRVFALPPGDYYVSASTQGLGELIGRGMQQLAAGLGALGGRGAGGGRGGGLAAALGPLTGSNEPEPTGYAPTYYPGVVNAPEAGKVTVGPGAEVAGIDFQIQLVPLATISGMVAGAEDVVAVMLMADDPGGRGPLGGPTLTGRSQADGTFSITNVPPGRYTAIARAGGRRGDPKTAMQSIVVDGQNLAGVSLILMPPLTLSGNITVESSGTPAPNDYSGFRIDVQDVTPLPFAGGGPGGGGGRGGLGGAAGRAQKNGAFAVGNLLPGKHYIRVAGGGAAGGQGQGRGPAQGRGQAQGQWTLKSVLIAGQDVTDQPIDLKPGQNVDNVTIVLTDRTTEVTGTVRDVRNAPMTAITVIAFSTDQQYWRAQSRQIQTARTDATGAYRLRGLPPGDYFILAVDGVEQGEWFDPAFLEQARAGAGRLTVREGETKAQDLTLKIFD